MKKLLFDFFADWTEIFEFLKDKKCELKTKGIIEVTSAEFTDDYEINLTGFGLWCFYGEDACYYVPQKPSSANLILSENINEKELTYDALVKEQIAFFENSMQHEQYNALRCRLHERNLPSGICALFYGMPGTGKTESVMQIARKTNRNVMHIDIAETKSCWYGESEKLIKKLFADYKKECAAARRAKLPIPILLFNEADAIISTRKSATSSNVAQTENAIQNIILENLESFDGIMIATTNLAENFDKAFERRFLFKVKFEKASTETSSKIWMSKLEKLSEEQAYELARTYNFSGGEIDNISRKILMNEIITGEAVCFDEIKTFCQQEKLECAETKRIGFC